MMHKKYNIAIVGATGIVGETLLQLLAERNFPVDQLYVVASERSVGETVLFQHKPLMIEALDIFDFSKAHIAFFAAGTDVSELYAPRAATQGCTVIDKSTAFRYSQKIPLVVPEVNANALAYYPETHIIANPNCTVIPIVAAIKPIYDAFGITRMNIATYQSVSGAGKKGINALSKETAALLNGETIDECALNKPIAFNVIPHIDPLQNNRYTLEEMKLVWETQKILHDQNILINPTAVRVPVFFGHSAAIHLETKRHADAKTVLALLQKAPGVTVLETDYPTPVTHAAHHDAIFVGRVRNDISHPNGLNLWVVADNVRKGAALNAIQIAELLLKNSFYRH